MTRATPCDPDVVEVRPVVRRLSAACGRSHYLDAAPSAMSRVSLSSSVSESVSSGSSGLWYSLLLSSLKQTVSRYSCQSGSVLGSINSLVCIVVLRERLGGLDRTLFSLGESEGTLYDGWRLPNVIVQELPGSFIVFPIQIPRCPVRRRVYVVPHCLLGVLADWSQWSWVQRHFYVLSDFQTAQSADCQNWLVATHA